MPVKNVTVKAKNKLKASEKLKLKSNYAVQKVFKPFYTGGAVAVDNQGDFVFCTCGDKVFAVSTTSGLAEKSLPHEGDDVTSFEVSPDGSCIVTATRSLLLKQWKWPETQCVRTWKAIHIAPVLTLCFDNTSTLLASGSSDNTIKVWDLIRQYCTHNFRGIPGVVSCLCFHPKDLKLYCSGNDYVIKVWDLNTSKCVGALESHVSAVTSLKFPSDDLMVSSGRDSVVNFWNIAEDAGKPMKTIPVFETVEDLICLPGEEMSEDSEVEDFKFLTFGNRGVVRQWHSKSGKCVSNDEDTDSEESFGYVHAKLMPDGKSVMAVTSDHNFDFIFVEDLKTHKHFVGYNDEVLDVKMFGENEEFLIVSTNSPKIKVFNIETSACQLLKGHKDTVLALDVFKNQLYFASCSKDQTVRLWKMNKNTNVVSCVAVGQGHTHTVESLACCKQKMNFCITGSEDHTLKVWSIIKTEDGSSVELTVQHTILAHTKDINSVAVSPNDKLIASGSQDKLAKLWTVEDGQNIGTFRGHKRGIWCVQFSPMDQVLASSSADGTIKLWGLSDFSCLKTLEGHDCSVLKLCFIVKGTQILSCGSDGLLKLWTVKSSECNKTLDEHSDKIWTLTTSRNSENVVTGSADSTIVLWEDVTEKEKEEEYQKQEDSIIQYQELQNLLQEKNYKQALTKAILLQHPFTALNVVREILWQTGGMQILEEIIAKQNLDRKHTLLNFAVSWNTNSRNCHEAQAVLNVVLSSTHPRDIENFHDSQKIIEALLPYSERHYQRMNKISQQATFVDYTFQLMKLTINE